MAAGIDQTAIDQVDDSDEPKSALVGLLLDLHDETRAASGAQEQQRKLAAAAQPRTDSTELKSTGSAQNSQVDPAVWLGNPYESLSVGPDSGPTL